MQSLSGFCEPGALPKNAVPVDQDASLANKSEYISRNTFF